MMQDSVRVSRGWRSQEGNELRATSRVNDVDPDSLYSDKSFTTLALCEEPPSLADLMRPNSTTSFLIY